MTMQLGLLLAFLICQRAPMRGATPAERLERRCVFLASQQNLLKAGEAGNVSEGIQRCAHTRCCMGSFQLVNGQPRPDLQGCNIVATTCPEATCTASTHYHNYITCACSTDLCNSNITWRPENKTHHQTYTLGPLSASMFIIPAGALIFFCFLVAVRKWSHYLRDCNRWTSSHEVFVSSLCSCDISEDADSDLASVEFQKVLDRGHFACVWQGKYQGSAVALKVFPAALRQAFAKEKEVYTLPLMTHPGIAHFVGAGRELEMGQWVLVLELAAQGSLNAFLTKTVCDWASTVKLAQSLSQGLAYLHSDISKNGLHKPAVAHGDLSSSNVLVRADGSCALCDFGCSSVLRYCGTRQRWQCHVGTAGTQASARMGTLRYMSPEMLEGYVNLSSGGCLMQGDVYALGLLLWELFKRSSDLCAGSPVKAHSLPYEAELGSNPSLEQLLVLVTERRQRPLVPQQWSLISQTFPLLEILEDCWDPDPDARLTAQCAANRLASLPPRCSL